MMLDAKHCDHRQTLENGEAGSAFRIRVIGLVLDDTAVHQSRARRSSHVDELLPGHWKLAA